MVLAQCLVFSPVSDRAMIIETLGIISGNGVVNILLELAGHSDAEESGVVCRALSLCATEKEAVVFRKAVERKFRKVRLACADMLGEFPDYGNVRALSRLTADPHPLVVQRTREFLEARRLG